MKRSSFIIRKYGVVFILTALLAILGVLCLKTANNYIDRPFAILLRTGKDNQFIELYEDETENHFYMFLPSYASSQNTRIRILTTYPVHLDDIQLKEGMRLDVFETDYDYILKVNDNFIGTLTFMHSSNIPAVFIETSRKDLPFLMEDKNNIDEGTVSFIWPDGEIDYAGDLDVISGRGNQSWALPKRGWSIRLPEEKELLNMRSSARWNLIANVCDDTNGLRNKAAHYLAEQLGMEFTARQQFVDLYIDSLYYGTYQLTEEIEQKKDKLDIGDLDHENYLANGFILDTDLLERQTEYYDDLPIRSYSTGVKSPEDISGGYIIERNSGFKLKEKEHLFTTNRNETFIVRYPSVVNEEELDYINNTVQIVEDELFAENDDELWNLADIDSFVKKFLIDELSKNEGEGVTSSYYYKKQGQDILYAGPVWDFDKSFGNCGVWKDPNGLALGKLYSASITYWYERVYANSEANALIKQLYTKTVKPGCKELMENLIDDWAEEISESRAMNEARWKYVENENPAFYDGLDIDYHHDIKESVQYLKTWINDRLTYLDGIWTEGEN